MCSKFAFISNNCALLPPVDSLSPLTLTSFFKANCSTILLTVAKLNSVMLEISGFVIGPSFL